MAGSASEGKLVPQRQAIGGQKRVQKRKQRSDTWTQAQVREFMAVLAESCNASEAARAVGKCRQGAYDRRRRDPAFARAWDAALDQGYAELELLLMRAALHGSESEEITLDGEGAVKTRKVKRAPNLSVGLRLWQHYRERVAKIRGTSDDAGPTPEEQAQVRRALAEIRRRRAAAGE
jgi:hypothetical protein